MARWIALLRGVSIPAWAKCEPHPVKRTVKKYKVFLGQQLCAAGRFLCSEIKFMLLHWSLMRGSIYL